MADWWNPKSRATMPLGGDWWGTASTVNGGAPAPARSLDFTQPGAGLQNAGIDEKDMYPRFEKLRAHSEEKGGGNAQLWKNLDRWETTPNAAHVDAEQKKLFDHYHATGERLPGLKDETVAAALDWGVREGTRSQVHKKTFMQSTLGKLLSVPITAAGFAVGGPLGAGVANGLYQGVGNHDVLAGLGGFASGYAGGSLGGKVLGVNGNAAGLPGGGTFSGMLGGGAGAAGPEKYITKGASGIAKALRNRRKTGAPPSYQTGPA